ncbi:4-phosphoerythronate dehydrogenase [Longimonas halophila]|uniref:4-phosphoerythronate dehydrogenase n=1 Tax=Longimonas halophila TaxID=1469170 RepID=UPI001FE3404C|nr:4-phosphoerythronate dehydrogenase [Longimonas halophila]
MPDLPSLRILADENIPHVHEAFGTLGTVTLTPGRAISASDVQAADVLLVRSVTEVNASLIQNHALQFVGSATIGTDHVNQAALSQRGIPFAHAPGSNADSVADYVLTALLHHATRTGTDLPTRTVGVVGCGNTGRRVARRCEALGCRVLRNDPPRAKNEPEHADQFVSLDTLLQKANIISLHVPLTTGGPHATRHLLDTNVVAAMQPGTWLVNTSRGAVVEANAVRHGLRDGPISALLFDVWPGEPAPAPDLIRDAAVATPHIAGYAYDGKVRGTHMLYQALCDVLDRPATWQPNEVLAAHAPDTWHLAPPSARWPRTEAWHALAQQAYTIADDDRRMRALASHPPEERAKAFADLRRTYPIRREMNRYAVAADSLLAEWHQPVSAGLTMQLTVPGATSSHMRST